jgi:nicotinate-nucleotide adenylyltransferase
MRVALFGGTFDPIHTGHLTAAIAAQQTFSLDEIRLVPSGVPPHKQGRPVTAFADRYAMVALACDGIPHLAPSRLEDPEHHVGTPNYTIDTIRRFKEHLTSTDQLFFLIGADAFLGIRTWREPIAILHACDFIVVSRPGFDIGKIQSCLPEGTHAGTPRGNCIPLEHSTIHLLSTVHADISSSEVRRRAARGESLVGLVPVSVADYISKRKVYAQDIYGQDSQENQQVCP